MKAEDAIIKAMKRPKGERGLRISRPNDYLSEGHMKKADHDLIVMTDLNNLGHEDWVVIVAYYSMYHASLSLLSKIGKESKDKIELISIEEKYINYLWKAKQARETVQYGISINYKETNIVMNNAR